MWNVLEYNLVHFHMKLVQHLMLMDTSLNLIFYYWHFFSDEIFMFTKALMNLVNNSYLMYAPPFTHQNRISPFFLRPLPSIFIRCLRWNQLPHLDYVSEYFAPSPGYSCALGLLAKNTKQWLV